MHRWKWSAGDPGNVSGKIENYRAQLTAATVEFGDELKPCVEVKVSFSNRGIDLIHFLLLTPSPDELERCPECKEDGEVCDYCCSTGSNLLGYAQHKVEEVILV